MLQNVGGKDRAIRAIAGPALIALGLSAFKNRRAPKIASLITGAMMSQTALTKKCRLNKALGINTAQPQSQQFLI